MRPSAAQSVQAPPKAPVLVVAPPPAKASGCAQSVKKEALQPLQPALPVPKASLAVPAKVSPTAALPRVCLLTALSKPLPAAAK